MINVIKLYCDVNKGPLRGVVGLRTVQRGQGQ